MSKASLSNAEAIYQEAKKDLLINSSLPIAKLIQIQNRGIDKVVREQASELTLRGTISTAQSVPTELKQDSSKNNPNNTEQWTTDILSYTIGSSEQTSPQDIQKKKFKHPTPPSQTSEEEDVDVVSSPPKGVEETINEIDEDSLPDLTISKNSTKKRMLRSNSRQLEK